MQKFDQTAEDLAVAGSKLMLQDVPSAAVDRNGSKGGRALKRLAETRDLTLSYTTVDRILAGKYKSTPERLTVEVLAVLAGMPIEQVYSAVDLPMPQTSLAEQLPDGSDNLTVQHRRVVLHMIRGFVRDEDRMADLERQRDERPLPQHELLKWARESNRKACESMVFDELYDMVHYMEISAPSADEREEVFRAFAEASNVLEARQRLYMEDESQIVNGRPRKRMARDAERDGITATAGVGAVDISPGGFEAGEFPSRRGRNRETTARRHRGRSRTTTHAPRRPAPRTSSGSTARPQHAARNQRTTMERNPHDDGNAA